jgi:chromosome partitioning protein
MDEAQPTDDGSRSLRMPQTNPASGQLVPRPRRRPFIIAICNHKGGVAKTTTCVNLAVGLAAAGQQVIVVDLDSVGNASRSLGIVPPRTTGAYDLLTGRMAIDALGVPSSIPGVTVIPATRQMHLAEVEQAIVHLDGERLAERLSAGERPADTVIFDCPPALGVVSVTAIAAADLVMVPVSPSAYALDSLERTLEVATGCRASELPRPPRILITMADVADPWIRQMVDLIRRKYGEQVYPFHIPFDRSNAELTGEILIEHASDGQTGAAYLRLTLGLIKDQREWAKLALSDPVPSLPAGAVAETSAAIPEDEPPPAIEDASVAGADPPAAPEPVPAPLDGAQPAPPRRRTPPVALAAAVVAMVAGVVLYLEPSVVPSTPTSRGRALVDQATEPRPSALTSAPAPSPVPATVANTPAEEPAAIPPAVRDMAPPGEPKPTGDSAPPAAETKPISPPTSPAPPTAERRVVVPDAAKRPTKGHATARAKAKAKLHKAAERAAAPALRPSPPAPPAANPAPPPPTTPTRTEVKKDSGGTDFDTPPPSVRAGQYP